MSEDVKRDSEVEGEIATNDEQTQSRESQTETVLSEEMKQERRQEALGFKEEGNSLFKANDYEAAASSYSKGIAICPEDFKKDISVLYSNRATCAFYMEEYDACVEDATSALNLQETYQKPRLRRAAAYEKSEKLESALEDYKFVLERDPKCQVAGEAVMRLPDEIKDKNEKLKEEMMDKLKDLGNMVLKPFGLSTNNFKFEKDPSSGGYSVNFQR